MRCMLYSSRLGVEFWVDAIRHAVWLYNRTHHSAIECTPFQRYTGCKPCVSLLITFGSKVVARKPYTRSRQTSANPNAYDGIFLGYDGTSRNIKYYDINTKTIKTAHHDSKDETQYSDPPSERSPALTHLIEVFTEMPHEQVGSELKIPTKVIEIEPPNKKKRKKVDTEAIIDEILKNSSQPYTHAAAVKIKADLTKIADLQVMKLTKHTM